MTSLQVDSTSLKAFNAARFEHIIRILEDDKELLDDSRIRSLDLLSKRLVCQADVSIRIDRLPRMKHSVSLVPEIVETNRTEAKHQKFQGPQIDSRDESSIDNSTSQDMRILLQDQKDLARRDLEEAQSDRAALLEGVAEITGILKETIQSISSSVLEQNLHLDSIQVHATENQATLKEQKKQMGAAAEDMKLSFCFTLTVLLFVVATFVATYALIRLTPNGFSGLTCPVKVLEAPDL